MHRGQQPHICSGEKPLFAVKTLWIYKKETGLQAA